MSWFDRFRKAPIEGAGASVTDRYEKSTGLITNQAGEAIFKIVAVSYVGAVDWVQLIRDLTRPEYRGELQPVTESDGWRMVAFDFLLSGMLVQGHPVRFYLFGHEGIGFVGQPGTARDTVYKNAHAIIGLADGADARNLVAVLGADLERVRSQGQHPECILVTPAAVPLSGCIADAQEVTVDWRIHPLEPLKVTSKTILRSFQ